MSELYCKEILNQACNIVGLSDSATLAKMKQALDRANNWLAREGNWRWMKRTKQWRTVAPYTTGTVAVTVGSTAVTGTGTVWTAAMVDRTFVGPDGFRYHIASRSSDTAIVLADAYAGATVASLGTYSIIQDKLYLPAEAKLLVGIRRSDSPALMGQETRERFDILYPNPTDTGTPEIWAPCEPYATTYTTGTLAGTAGTSILTGSTTSWTTSLAEPFHKIRIGSQYFTIKSIDSDTQITVFETIGTTISASTTYVIELRWRRVQVIPAPGSIMGLPFYYMKYPTPLYQDTDIPDLDPEYHDLLVYWVVDDHFTRTGDPRAAYYRSIWQATLQQMRSKDLEVPGLASYQRGIMDGDEGLSGEYVAGVSA